MIARHGGNCPCIPPKQKRGVKGGVELSGELCL